MVQTNTARFFASFAPSSFIASHLRTAAKIEVAVDNVATHLADSYLVLAIVTIGGA
jgi:hypothetical protein